MLEKNETCAGCLGHGWMMWRRKQVDGYLELECRACPYCNPTGERPPPVFDPTDEDDDQAQRIIRAPVIGEGVRLNRDKWKLSGVGR